MRGWIIEQIRRDENAAEGSANEPQFHRGRIAAFREVLQRMITQCDCDSFGPTENAVADHLHVEKR